MPAPLPLSIHPLMFSVHTHTAPPRPALAHGLPLPLPSVAQPNRYNKKGMVVSRIIIRAVEAVEEVNVPVARADHRAPAQRNYFRWRQGGSEKTFTSQNVFFVLKKKYTARSSSSCCCVTSLRQTPYLPPLAPKWPEIKPSLVVGVGGETEKKEKNLQKKRTATVYVLHTVRYVPGMRYGFKGNRSGFSRPVQ